MNNLFSLRTVIVLVLLSFSTPSFAQLLLSTPDVESKLYLSQGDHQPLIVGLGGSEGGNAWSSNHWKATRDSFLSKGYAFLALGYFGAKGTPDILNKIAVDKVHAAIMTATQHEKIDKSRIAIIGGSRGGDLALLLGSYYSDITCIVAIVTSHAAFPGNTADFSTSAWTYEGKELPFVPVNEEAVPFMQKRDIRGAFEAMLKDTTAEAKALIKVEKINGPVLLISATQDAIAPTTPMCDKIMARLKQMHFKYHSEHVAIEGGHAAPLQHMDLVIAFMDKYFPAK